MKHFNIDECAKYKNNLLSQDEMKEMEDHLYNCQICMEVFLSTIGDQEIEQAKSYIPEDFNESLMESLSKIKPIGSTGKKKKLIKDYLFYYGAVASVAIVLTLSGVFGTMVDSVHQIDLSKESSKARFQPDGLFKLSESITNKTSDFINNFQFNMNKEEKNEN